MKRLVTIIILSLACLAVALGAGYYLGQRSGLAKGADAIAGYRSSDLAAIELHAERIMGIILRDLGRARSALDRGSLEYSTLQRLYGAATRSLDDANARLEAYRKASESSYDSRDASLERLRAIGRELESRYGLGD